MVWGQTGRYLITNRHVLDYNYKQPPRDVVPSAALASMEIRG